MLDRAPRIPQDCHDGAVNALRLAAMVRSDHLKTMLLKAAKEFLKKAGEIDAAS
jgi:hypothetical protein